MADVKKNLLLFFDRPLEPCFIKKREDMTAFQIPDLYYPDRYRNVAPTLTERFGTDNQLKVKEIALPDLSVPKELPYNEHFSLFIPKHRTMAGKLIDIFMGMRDLEDLLSICAYCQLNINPYMFNYCLSVAILHRSDTKGLDIPTFVETFPDKFLNPKAFQRVQKGASVEESGQRTPTLIPVNYTAAEWEPEQRVAYFREDIGINLHHWHWHLVYPYDAADRAIINKDRRGELFYYMHQQIVARYNVERMCNGLQRVKAFKNFREPITEGYFPKLDSKVASRAWPPRFAETTIRDLERPLEQIKIDVSDMETCRSRVIKAIEDLSIRLPNGKQMLLDEKTGIDVLGNLMESSVISLNRPYYGDMHNMGHLFISYSHDPDNRHLEQIGVMGDPATAMRDPVFYRWHKYVDEIFQLYKYKLTPYSDEQLNFSAVRVDSVTLGPAKSTSSTNMITTLWQQSTVELSRGMDFLPRGSIPATITHLQYEPYHYTIEVDNTTNEAVMGTVRIFMAPIFDEDNQPLSFDEQRKLMIEMDKFSEKLIPGMNKISRSSTDSSVTIPFERTFRDQADRTGEPGSNEASEFDFCGCGWPQHMLVPKGNLQGYPMMLFVMVSNWDDDKVEQYTAGSCSDAASYCGIRDRKYPDRRAMGFPFDRPIPTVAHLEDFVKRSNMTMKKITIRFINSTSQRGVIYRGAKGEM